ncbi:hypothetical protein Tco_1323094 [Tanacetum coccineum]
MEEYIRLEEEKAGRRGKVYNWETATYGKIWDNEDVHDHRSVEIEFPAIVFNDTLTSEVTLSCEPTVSSFNDEIEFRILFDDSDDEDYTHSLYGVFVKRIQRIRYRYQYDVSWGPRERNINKYWWRIYKSGDLDVLES